MECLVLRSSFIGILTTFPLLILFSSSERFYPQFYWVARNIWSNIILFGMGFWPVVENKKKLEKEKLHGGCKSQKHD